MSGPPAFSVDMYEVDGSRDLTIPIPPKGCVVGVLEDGRAKRIPLRPDASSLTIGANDEDGEAMDRMLIAVVDEAYVALFLAIAPEARARVFAEAWSLDVGESGSLSFRDGEVA